MSLNGYIRLIEESSRYYKFWIKPEGDIEVLKHHEHHLNALSRLYRDSIKSWADIFNDGAIRGTIQGDIIGLAFNFVTVTDEALKTLKEILKDETIRRIFYDRYDITDMFLIMKCQREILSDVSIVGIFN
ncbi:MAG: hypothetical protein WC284_16080 [Candidimonas sp.]